MIISGYQDPTLLGLMHLLTSPLLFYPCGSRGFWNTARHDSDYDFFIEDSDAVRQWLVDKGFIDKWSDAMAYYADANTLGVFHTGDVDVVLVKSVERRLRAREWIKQAGLPYNATKSWDHYYLEIAPV